MTDTAARTGRSHKTSEKEQLSRDAWLDAAANAIAEGGFGNVRVLLLAKTLGVTRGSFYWHFKDHQDLIVSFLQRWRDRRLAELASWRPQGNDVRQESHRIMHVLLSESGRHLWRMKIELAVRDMARRDDLAAQIVAEVDQARIEQNVQLLQAIADNPDGANDLALLLYVATIGAQLITTGPIGDSAMVGRIERLIANLVLEWHQRGGGELLPAGAMTGEENPSGVS